MLNYSKLLELLSTLLFTADLSSNLHSLDNVSPFWESKCSIWSKYHYNESIRSFSTLAFIIVLITFDLVIFLSPFYKSFIPSHIIYHLLGGLLSYDFLFSSNVLSSFSNFYLVISFIPRQFCLCYRTPLECHNFPHHWSYQLHFCLILTSFDLPKDLHLSSDYPTRSRASSGNQQAPYLKKILTTLNK